MNNLANYTTIIKSGGKKGILFGTSTVPASGSDVKKCLPIQVCFFAFDSASFGISTATFYSYFFTKITDLIQVQYNGETFYAAAWGSSSFPENFNKLNFCSCSNAVSIIGDVFYS